MFDFIFKWFWMWNVMRALDLEATARKIERANERLEATGYFHDLRGAPSVLEGLARSEAKVAELRRRAADHWRRVPRTRREPLRATLERYKIVDFSS